METILVRFERQPESSPRFFEASREAAKALCFTAQAIAIDPHKNSFGIAFIPDSMLQDVRERLAELGLYELRN